MSKHESYSDDGRYVSVPAARPLSRPAVPGRPWTPYPRAVAGIETCAGCSQLGLGTAAPTAAATSQFVSERPWWFWLAIGGGIGLVAGIAHAPSALRQTVSTSSMNTPQSRSGKKLVAARPESTTNTNTKQRMMH